MYRSKLATTQSQMPTVCTAPERRGDKRGANQNPGEPYHFLGEHPGLQTQQLYLQRRDAYVSSFHPVIVDAKY